ncbi:MAG: glycoside hydrolase family 25 domain-containing protein [Candidatus Dormibacteria bacterium]
MSLATMSAGQAATGSPYSGVGYDASGCVSSPPAGASFAILRDTGGRPFSASSCIAELWNASGTPASKSIYFNTGYSGAYTNDTTNDCTAAAAQTGLAGKARQAYAIGCSEAEWAISHSPSASATVGWWADIEVGNSWSTNNLQLNVDTIRGILDRLALAGQPYGIYSTRSSWQTVTGGYTGFSAPDWVVGSDAYACGGSGFSSGSVWLIQTAAGSSYDSDNAC